MPGFESNLANMAPILYYNKSGFIENEAMSLVVALSGHKDLGIAFNALDGVVRGAASLGARNAARSIFRISQLQVPFDTGYLQSTGSIEKGEGGGAVDVGAVGRKIGGFTGGSGLDQTKFDPTGDGPVGLEGSSLSDFVSSSDTFRNAISEFRITYGDEKAWFIHEVEQTYHQAGEPTSSGKGQLKVPDSQGRRRGAKFLERALEEVAPKYPDWVAAEIQAMLDKFKPPPTPPKPAAAPSMAPRLVKRVK